MRGAPQEGFSLHILRISARTSGEMMGRPGWPQRAFQVQNRRNPARCSRPHQKDERIIYRIGSEEFRIASGTLFCD